MAKNPSNKEVPRFKLVKSLNDPRLTVHPTGDYILYRDYKLLIRNMHTQINSYKNKVDDLVKAIEKMEKTLKDKRKKKTKNKRSKYLFIKTSIYTSDGILWFEQFDSNPHEKHSRKLYTVSPIKINLEGSDVYGWYISSSSELIKATHKNDLLIYIIESI